MKNWIFTVFLGCLLGDVFSAPVPDTLTSYLQQRAQVIDTEGFMRIGGTIALSQKEQDVNQILMKAKREEINNSRKFNGSQFPPAIHFFQGKSLIEQSKVFQLIKKMPKGGALHLHDCCITDLMWLVKNVTYLPNCYMCTNQYNEIQFRFFQNPPSNPSCPWKLIADERRKASSVDQFDQMLYNSMSLVVDNPDQAYPTINDVWRKFDRRIYTVRGLINYKPVFGQYYYQALKGFRDDNIQYIETRGLPGWLYNLDGSASYNRTEIMQIYKETLDQFTRDHPDFIGGRIIRAGSRRANASKVLQEVKESMEMMKLFPDHFVGFDLVGQEDTGRPLLDYVGVLQYPTVQTPSFQLPYFFHAGETDWEGTQTDNNLVDAVLLNSTRIGHGYTLPKHPEVMKVIKSKSIAIEVNPISNQVLKLVDDMRNHPASILIAQDFPIVISSDDPAVWGAPGLSYDFYMAFMGLAGEDADLTMLKQLAINSLKYSSLPDMEKTRTLNLFENKWNQFVDEVLLHSVPGSVVVG